MASMQHPCGIVILNQRFYEYGRTVVGLYGPINQGTTVFLQRCLSVTTFQLYVMQTFVTNRSVRAGQRIRTDSLVVFYAASVSGNRPLLAWLARAGARWVAICTAVTCAISHMRAWILPHGWHGVFVEEA